MPFNYKVILFKVKISAHQIPSSLRQQAQNFTLSHITAFKYSLSDRNGSCYKNRYSYISLLHGFAV